MFCINLHNYLRCLLYFWQLLSSCALKGIECAARCILKKCLYGWSREAYFSHQAGCVGQQCTQRMGCFLSNGVNECFCFWWAERGLLWARRLPNHAAKWGHRRINPHSKQPPRKQEPLRVCFDFWRSSPLYNIHSWHNSMCMPWVELRRPLYNHRLTLMQ